MFAIDLGQNSDPAALLGGAVNFLGNWTARIYNPYSKWVNGVGSAFEKENVNVPVGVNGQFGGLVSVNMQPLKIYSFEPEITVANLASGEVVTVRVRLEFADNTYSNSVVKTFTSTTSVWLSDDDMMQMYPSQDVIWAVVVDAQPNRSSSSATVSVNGYGNAG